MSRSSPPPRGSRPFSDALLRNHLRNQNNPRRAGIWAGLSSAVVLFLVFTAVYLIVGGGGGPVFLVLILALVGSVLLGAFVGVTASALMHRTVGMHRLPADTDPAVLRSAVKAMRSGELSGDPEVDRLARTMAAQELRNTLQSPVGVTLFVGFFSALSLFQLVLQYQSNDGWGWLALFHLGLILCFAVLWPLLIRRRWRIRAFVEAYDARGSASSEGQAERS